MKFKSNKRKKIKSYFSLIIFILICSIFFSLFIIKYYSKEVDKIFKPIATQKARKFITKSINESTLGVDFNKNLINIEKDMNDEIKMINYNSQEVINLLDRITFDIQDKLDLSTNNDYVICYIPFGIIFGNTILNNIGPKIPVKFKMLGDIISNIETEVKSYGINSAYVEVRVYLEVSGVVVLPFSSEKITVRNTIPISISVISGNVPSSYIASYK